MITLSHWFIPYKVEGGKLSFQCGTKRIQANVRQGKAIKPKKPKPKVRILEYLQLIFGKKKAIIVINLYNNLNVIFLDMFKLIN